MIKTIKFIIMSALVSLVVINTNAASQPSISNDKFGSEFNLTLGTTYPIDKEFIFANTYDVNIIAGAQLYFNKYIGIEGNVPVYHSNGPSLQEVESNVLLRAPLFDTIAPYIGAGVTYNWNESKVLYQAKAGVEVRLIQNVGIFTEGVYKIENLSNYKDGSFGLQGGLRISF